MPNPRNMRATYIALASIGAGVVVLAVSVVLLFMLGFLRLPEPPVSVPNLGGLAGPTARSRLAQLGLVMGKGDVRFSATVEKGTVLDQTPAAGMLVPRGTVITVALSAGSDRFAMPDVTGLQVTSALATLRGKGLATRVENVDSRLASGTVIATMPSPGTEVSTSDIVTVRVSAGARGSALLLPFDLKGVNIVIDPAAAAGTPDIAYDVARRLRSLLEASGARVVETRSVVDTNPPSVQRQLRSLEASPTLVIGLYATPDPPAGLRVSTVPASGVIAPFYLRSVDLAKSTLAALTDAGLKASSDGSVGDPVLGGTPAPGERIHLGTYSDRSDARDFSDPAWADLVARALYRGIGQTLAPRVDGSQGASSTMNPTTSTAAPTTTAR